MTTSYPNIAARDYHEYADADIDHPMRLIHDASHAVIHGGCADRRVADALQRLDAALAAWDGYAVLAGEAVQRAERAVVAAWTDRNT